MSTATAPETVTLTLDGDQSTHTADAINQVLAKYPDEGAAEAVASGEKPFATAANVMSRGILEKLPEAGGEVELTLAEAFRLELALSMVDADFNGMARMLGMFEASPALEAIRAQLDSALEGVDDEAIEAVAGPQNDAIEALVNDGALETVYDGQAQALVNDAIAETV